MRIGILGCDAIKDELELITAGEPDVVLREYLEFGLHLHPDELKKAIMDKISQLEGKVDLLFLGYAHCQALKGLPQQVKLPVVMLEQEDCIASLLSTERYHAEKKKGGITWFYPAGWAKYGMPGVINLFELNRVNTDEYDPNFFLKLMFDGFSRCLFIETGVGDAPTCRCHSQQFARNLNLEHEETVGSLHLLLEAWNNTKALAAEMERKDQPG
ncbi:MAG: DUF1638 domain-containing protein, partial [Candidatus Saccharibacteria bacterium]